MPSRETFVHLFAGGMGGTMGAIATCPLEVVKTRLQSSHGGFELHVPAIASESRGGSEAVTCRAGVRHLHTHSRRPNLLLEHQALERPPPPSGARPGLLQCIRIIIEREGAYALWKGLGPNLVGVAPSRAIYFCAYQNTKNVLNVRLTPETPVVHMASALCAGFTSCTLTNPIWFVKTRLQLDQRQFGKRLPLSDTILRVYRQQGIRGFYRGITASYFGITETMIHFVIYEWLKRRFQMLRSPEASEQTGWHFIEFMAAGAVSKTVASSCAYPHEVARTRLREEGSKYRGFFQTLQVVWMEEGWRGLYRGLGTQLIRQIPNTAIMMSTYEFCVYMLRDTDDYDVYDDEVDSPAYGDNLNHPDGEQSRRE